MLLGQYFLRDNRFFNSPSPLFILRTVMNFRPQEYEVAGIAIVVTPRNYVGAPWAARTKSLVL
jgi:hypothetical protein